MHGAYIPAPSKDVWGYNEETVKYVDDVDLRDKEILDANGGVSNRVAGMTLKFSLLGHSEAVTAITCFERDAMHWLVSHKSQHHLVSSPTQKMSTGQHRMGPTNMHMGPERRPITRRIQRRIPDRWWTRRTCSGRHHIGHRVLCRTE